MRFFSRFLIFSLSVPLLSGLVSCASIRKIVHRDATSSSPASYDYLASEFESRKNLNSESLKHLDKALQKDPAHPYLWYKRALLLASQDRFAEAMEDLQKSLNLDPEDPESLLLLGKIYQKKEEWADAVPAYQKAIIRSQGQIRDEATVLLVEAWINLKKYPEALNALDQWHKRDSESVIPLFYKASIHQNILKNSKEAIHDYQKILEVEPDNAKALSSLADLFATKKQDKQVLDVFGKMEAIAPNDVSLKLKMALIYYENKDYDKAIQKFEELRSLYPKDERLIYYMGVVYENLSKDDKALKEFSLLMPPSDFHRDAQLHRAYILNRNNKRDEAIGVLKSAIKLSRKTSHFYEYLSEIYRDRDQFKEAKEVLQLGLKNSFEKEALLFDLGIVYEYEDNQEQAIEVMKRLLKINPKHTQALNYIGYTYADRHEHLDEAEAMLKKAVALQPNDGYILDSWAWVQYQKGNVDFAFEILQKALKLTPNEPTILEHLGDVYMKRGNKKDALSSYQKSLKRFELERKKTNRLLKDIERLHKKVGAIN